MKVNYSFLESRYKEIRQQIIDQIVNAYDLSEDKAIGIVDYENSKILGEEEHNQVKALMEQDMQKNRPFHILPMVDVIMNNDEGKYQLELKNNE